MQALFSEESTELSVFISALDGLDPVEEPLWGGPAGRDVFSRCRQRCLFLCALQPTCPKSTAELVEPGMVNLKHMHIYAACGLNQ